MSGEPIRGVETSMGQPGFCEQCGRTCSKGPDACLGELPGVSHACCGHGDPRRAYVTFGGEPDQDAAAIENKVTLRGQDAVDFFAMVARARTAEANAAWNRPGPP